MVRRGLPPLLAAVGVLTFAGTAVAQTNQDRADARCFIVLQMFKAAAQREGQLKAEDQVTIDKMGAYFIGKMRGRNPASTPIGSIVTSEIARAAAVGYLKDAPACLNEAKQYSADFAGIVPVIRDATRQMEEEAAKLPTSGN